MRKSENLYRTSTPSLLLNIPFLPKSIKAFSGFFRNYVPIFHQTNFSTRCAGSKRAGFSAYSPLKRSASPGGAPDRFFSRTEKNGALLPQEKWSNPRNKSTRGSKRPAPIGCVEHGGKCRSGTRRMEMPPWMEIRGLLPSQDSNSQKANSMCTSSTQSVDQRIVAVIARLISRLESLTWAER